MGFLTKYGTIWGQIPTTAGRVFWVAPADGYTVDGRAYRASDDNDGLSPERALRTIARAWALVSANVGDVIVLLPGTHTIAALITANVAGVTMTGLPSGRGNVLAPKTTVQPSAVIGTMTVSAANIEVAHLEFVPAASQTSIDLTADADALYIHDCAFNTRTGSPNAGTISIEALGAAADVLIEHCEFPNNGANGNAIVATALVDSRISDCVFQNIAGTWASCILCGAATDRLMIERCRFYNSGTAITAGVNGTGADQADGVKVVDCRFDTDVTVPIDNFSAGECNIAENYDMGIGATDGGALITAIT